ncbi:hypothetical protein CKM354_001002000 [Cercospora kikuchii]|uniref:Uncharacterized protein n=1 Tax=Cercospora kikuchii TaxID=84275 RepID=A0A9P3CLX2_9PEZI|nr:uncharacterized protein CKM354_001002000 [Cercospora kikuchii]GIZ46914.1 hypothetical protein CKM354_001002000 [Cercospora kikuchii]
MQRSIRDSTQDHNGSISRLWTVLSFNADRKEDQAPATSSLRFAGDLTGPSVLLLITAAAIAALATFLSPENGIWVKACVTNAVICWLSGKFRFTRESEPAEPDLTASSAQQSPVADHENLTLHAQIALVPATSFLLLAGLVYILGPHNFAAPTSRRLG